MCDVDLAGLILSDEEVAARLEQAAKPAPRRPPRLPRQAGLFAATPLARIMDRRHDGTYGPRTRLLMLLEIKSRRGQRQVRLTNEMAAEIGLDRPQKSRCLSYLASHGYIRVEQVGQATPVVTVLPPWSG
jgi:hypothetical protein